jgi:DtxR family Mn-dependent transcriptional regulator
MTISVENFVKTIYKQSKLLKADTKLSTVAGLLNITNAAATDMARKLATKKLVNYTKYKPLTLTPSGKKLALKVIRKHRLWESFLHRTLNLSLHEIHKEAEYLEHLTSDFLAEKIEQYLGCPTIDPHGDPIPTYNGMVASDKSQLLLSEAEAGKSYKISRLYSSEKDFFDFCNANHITLGTRIRVERQYDSKKMTEIIINQNRLLLNELFTHVIFVKQII